MLLLLFVAAASCCSPGTPFYPKEGLPKWIEEMQNNLLLTTTATTTTAATTPEEPILPSPEPLVEVTSPAVQSTTLSWKQISAASALQQNNYRPVADSFSEIYRRLEQQNMQHLVAVEPEGQRPPWV